MIHGESRSYVSRIGYAVVGVVVLVTLMTLIEFESVDSTEGCIETRYGKVVTERMSDGLNTLFLTDATCFPLIDQNFPDDEGKEGVEAQTSDPITIQGDVAIVWAYDPGTLTQVFKDKRSHGAVEIEVRNAIREGYRSALAGWSVADIFSSKRAALADSVEAHIQRKIGKRAVVKTVFVRDIKVPQSIESARIAAAQQAQVLDKVEKDKAIANAESEAKVARARGEAESKRLLAQSYANNTQIVALEIAKEYAKLCGQATTCFLGNAVLERLPGFGGRP